jgi:hypothetical protein
MQKANKSKTKCRRPGGHHLKGIWWISKGNEGERKVMKGREEKRSEAGFGF